MSVKGPGFDPWYCLFLNLCSKLVNCHHLTNPSYTSCAPKIEQESTHVHFLLARQSHQAPRSATVLVLLLVGIVRVHFLYLNPKICKYLILVLTSYHLVWAEPKTYATSAILYLIKLVSYHFTIKPSCYYDTNKKLLKRAF
jgi:hypothetical protein